MKGKIHIGNLPEPISHHGQTQIALCKALVHNAQPLVIVPDASQVPVGILADTFGRNMCGACQMIEPTQTYVYFLVDGSEVLRNRRQPEYQEAV